MLDAVVRVSATLSRNVSICSFNSSRTPNIGQSSFNSGCVSLEKCSALILFPEKKKRIRYLTLL